MVLQYLDIGCLSDAFDQRLRNSQAGCVGGVNDPPLTVATLSGQMEFNVGAIDPGKRDALLNQPMDSTAGTLDGIAHGGRIT